MSSLKIKNQIIYFTNEGLNSTIGLSISKSLKPMMWFKEHDDIITNSKFIGKKIDKLFTEYINVDKLVVQFGEYSSYCICASISNTYISIITLNTNHEQKASYKLHLYKYNSSNSDYSEIGIYYSYFS